MVSRATARILGIDPGLARVGWGVIECTAREQRLIAFGAVSTGRSTPHAERLLQVYQGVQTIIIEHEPEAVAVEEVFQGKNPRSAFLAGEGRGACILAAATRSLPVVEYPATVVKQAITGNGRAAKQQVQAMVQRLLILPEIPKPHDAADALAIALTHARRSNPLPQLRRS